MIGKRLNLSRDKLEANKFELTDLKGGFKSLIVGSILGAAAWAAKEYLPPLIIEFKNSLHRTITIDADATPELFNKLEIWLEEQERIYCSQYVAKRIAKKNKVHLSVGFGTSLYKIKGRICIIQRSKENSSDSWKREEKITIKILYTRDMEIVTEIMEEIYSVNISSKNEDRVKISCGWTDYYKNKRGLNTVAMNQSDKDFIVNDIQKFLDSREYYTKRGLVYKRNYILYGEPGTGKTSLIWALASHFNKPINIVDISDVESSSRLQSILARNEGCLNVFEDIDAMNANVKQRAVTPAKISEDGSECVAEECVAEEKSDSKISMSSILNVFDGLNTPDGSICIFTTNHIKKLDKAFLRDGRMDVRLELGKINKKEIIENIANNILGDLEVSTLEEHLDENILINPAECQTILMDNSIEEAVKKLNKKVKTK